MMMRAIIESTSHSRKWARSYLINLLVSVMILSSASCSFPLLRQDPTPTSSLPVSSVTPTPRDSTFYAAYAPNYKWSKGTNGDDAKQAIIEHGFGEQLEALETEYHYRGIVKRLSSNFVLPVAYENNGEFYWNLTAKSNNGHFLKFTVRTGGDLDLRIQDIGMAAYQGEAPLFQVEELLDPQGTDYITQEIIWDSEGWAVFGAFQGETLVAWFDPFAEGGGHWVRLPVPLLAATPILPSQITFDKSRFETATLPDGKQYQGYVIEDEFGRRMVDEQNNIILTANDHAWSLPVLRVDSDAYPAVFSETKLGNIGGVELPVTLGLSNNVRQRSAHFVFSQVHMTQKAADALAPFFLFCAYARYRDVMHHPEVTYDEYIELVKLGLGNIEILDSKTKDSLLVDPRQGFSIVITGDEQSWMPLRRTYGSGWSFSASETGKLLVAVNSAADYDFYYHYSSRQYLQLRTASNATINSLYYFALLPDSCMATSDIIDSQCKVPPSPEGYPDAVKLWYEAYRDLTNGISSNPLIYFY